MMMRRREFLGYGLAMASTWPLPAIAANGPEVVQLWSGTPPGGGGPSGPPKVTASGKITNVAVPILEVFRPSRQIGSAVLVASGGGYRGIENGFEGYPAARWLMARGITAYVLTYRLPGEGWHAGHLVPFQDAQRAMRLITKDSAIDSTRVGVLGFSAGGHLLGMISSWFDHSYYEPIDEDDRDTKRPTATALIYPVITLEPPYDNTKTRRQIVGDNPSAALSSEWSVQTHVGQTMHSTFLVQAADDPISNPQNTAIMETACQVAGVSVERYLYSGGGHGFGMGRSGTPTMAWPGKYETWLRSRGLLA